MSVLKVKDQIGNWVKTPVGGVGVPSGGAAGQILMKSSATDYADEWADISKAGAMSKWDLVWQNASPASSFGPQTVSLDLSGYDFVVVFFTFDPQASVLSQCYFSMSPMDGWGQMMGQVNYRVKRQYQALPTGVVFYDGYSASPSGNLGTSTGAAIPQLIYGVRGARTV